MQIFISYHHADEDFAEVLRGKVEADASMRAWTFNERLRAGDDWRREIDRAIQLSSALVHVMTPEAAQSQYVTYEWAYAMGLGVPVIPVFLRRTELHPKLSALQYLDFTRTGHRPWHALLRDLKAQAQRRYAASGHAASRTSGEALERSPRTEWADPEAVDRLLRTLLDDPQAALRALRKLKAGEEGERT